MKLLAQHSSNSLVERMSWRQERSWADLQLLDGFKLPFPELHIRAPLGFKRRGTRSLFQYLPLLSNAFFSTQLSYLPNIVQLSCIGQSLAFISGVSAPCGSWECQNNWGKNWFWIVHIWRKLRIWWVCHSNSIHTHTHHRKWHRYEFSLVKKRLWKHAQASYKIAGVVLDSQKFKVPGKIVLAFFFVSSLPLTHFCFQLKGAWFILFLDAIFPDLL